jgi:hypothetical protein
MEFTSDELMAGYAAYASADDLSSGMDEGTTAFSPATISVITLTTATPTYISPC